MKTELVLVTAPWDAVGPSLLRLLDAIGCPPDRVLCVTRDAVPAGYRAGGLPQLHAVSLTTGQSIDSHAGGMPSLPTVKRILSHV